ncbi:MAG: porin [Sideroxyarcus sp.]|nr:porin [Sideroxyarcus sp.]
MSFKLTPIALLVMALYAVGVRADDADTPMYSFSGYGTLGVVHSSENKADFTSNASKPNGAGYSRSWSADVDSLIAGQVIANLTPQLTAVVQVISEQNYDNTYRPHVEWANIKYQLTPDISARVGRIVLPVFLVSDFRKVGYANPWVRTPVEVYGLLPITNSDGLDASYRVRIGEFTNTVQGLYGQSDPTFPSGIGTLKAKDMWGIAYTGEAGAATAHITYLKTNVSIDSFKPLFDGFRQFGAEGIALADKYDLSKVHLSFISLGAMYDPGGWFVMSEWCAIDSKAVTVKRHAWYASGGYRIGNFTPYLTYARVKADINPADPGLTVSALPPFLAGTAIALNAGLSNVLRSVPVQNTVSIGGRWDFMKNADIKLQFDHTRIDTGTIGSLINIQPDYQTGGKVNVFSATIDFVF